MKKIIYILIILLFTEFVSAQDYTGIGTTTPSTMLDINGALTNREGTPVVASGTTAIMPVALTNSQFRIIALLQVKCCRSYTDVNLTANSRILIHKLL